MTDCKNKDNCLIVQDVKELLLALDNLMVGSGLDCISVVADEEIAKKLLYHAINDDDYNIGTIDLNRYNYDDAYIVTLNSDADRELTIEKAKGESGNYLATCAVTFIQNNLPCKEKYIEDVSKNKYVNDFEPLLFSIGEPQQEKSRKPEKLNHKFEYANRYEDDKRFGEIYVTSNIADLVDLISTFFEEYFGI